MKDKQTKNSAPIAEPRLRSGEAVGFVRAEWLIALLPICMWSYFLFGGYALAAEALSMAVCLLTDFVIRLIRRRKDPLLAPFDLTPAVVGLTVAFLLPSDCPLWLYSLAALLAALIGGAFGAMSNSPICLPAAAVIVVRAIFPSRTDPVLVLDSEEGRTVAELLAEGQKPTASIVDLLLGRTDGMIGEIASLFILLAAAYLIYRKHIGWQVPLAWLAGGALTAYLTAPDTMSVYYYTGAQLLTGGFLLVGCLIVSNRITAPITPSAGLVVGALGGILTILFRQTLNVDGALLAALIVSLIARPLDRLLAPIPFGGRRK